MPLWDQEAKELSQKYLEYKLVRVKLYDVDLECFERFLIIQVVVFYLAFYYHIINVHLCILSNLLFEYFVLRWLILKFFSPKGLNLVAK